MEKLLKTGFLGCLALLPVSCWLQDDFISDLQILPAVTAPPSQRTTPADVFNVSLNGVNYRVEPQFDYDLHGLVVSLRHHDGDRMVHRLWNDHLNVADVCVVWGRNATDLDLNDYDFSSGEFTCFVRTGDFGAWNRFDMHGLSNNHLITEDLYLRDQIESLRIGDQIRIRGWLASYSHGDGFLRGTSTTRTDEGNGACETIYVKSFQVLSSMGNGWRPVFEFSLLGLFGFAILWTVGVMRGTFRHQAAD